MAAGTIPGPSPSHERAHRGPAVVAIRGGADRDVRAGRAWWARWRARWPGLREGSGRVPGRGSTPSPPEERRIPLGLPPALAAVASGLLLLVLLPALLPGRVERADAAQAPRAAAADGAGPERKADAAGVGEAADFGPPREAEVVRALRAWRDALERRARAVEADRTAALALIERIDGRIGELDARIAKLTALRDEIRTLLRELEGRQKERIARLVKIYEGMKPKRAARIFDQLDMDTLLPIARGMRPARLAVILQNMAPERARELTRRLSERPELPDLSPLGPLAADNAGATAGGAAPSAGRSGRK